MKILKYGKLHSKLEVIPYNDQKWCLKNGKYQHLIQNRSFQKYHHSTSN